MIEQANIFNLKANSFKQADLTKNLASKNNLDSKTSKFEQVFSQEVSKKEVVKEEVKNLTSKETSQEVVKETKETEKEAAKELGALEEGQDPVTADRMSMLLALLNKLSKEIEDPEVKLDLGQLDIQVEELLDQVDLASLDQDSKLIVLEELENLLAKLPVKEISEGELSLGEFEAIEQVDLRPILEKVSENLKDKLGDQPDSEVDLELELPSVNQEPASKTKEVSREVKEDIKLDDEKLEVNIDLEEVESLDLDTEEDSSQMDLSKFDNPSKVLTNNMGEDLVALEPELSFSPNFEIPEEDIVKQVVSKMDFKLTEGKNEVTVQLKPEILGNMKMDIELEKGTITAKILVDNHRTKEVIETNIASLQSKLEENGMEIKTVEVSVGNNADFEKQDRDRQFDNFKRHNKRIKSRKDKLAISKNYESNLKVEGYDSREINLEEGMNLFV